MGSSHSKAKQQPSERSRALVLYDNSKAREARQHTNSDFVDPRSLVDHLRPGDMIQKKGNYIEQWFYSHFAVFIGNGQIVHVNKPDGQCFIFRDNMEDAFCGELVRKNNHLDNDPNFRRIIRTPRVIVRAARGRVGERWNYNPFTNNCEHFATWCRYGRSVSLQSFGFMDLSSGKITFSEYIAHSVYRIKEKATTFYSWIKRKTVGFFDAIG